METLTDRQVSERKAAKMKKTEYLWNALIVLVIAAMTFVATGCNKEPNPDNPTTAPDHPAGKDHPAGDHPAGDHPKK
jgi:hypothetical protein